MVPEPVPPAAAVAVTGYSTTGASWRLSGSSPSDA
jgi:hypothetical protein